MTKLKFIVKNKKNHKLKKVYNINSKKTMKFNRQMKLGTYVPNIKLYIFVYSILISYLKLGYTFSKQFSLLSLFYLKKILKQNLN